MELDYKESGLNMHVFIEHRLNLQRRFDVSIKYHEIKSNHDGKSEFTKKNIYT